MSNAGIYIGLSGIQAQTKSMDVVSQNIANVNTPGYTRETANLSAVINPGSNIGSGAIVASVSQISDSFLQAQAQSASADSHAATSLSSALSSAQTNFQEPSPIGINEQLSSLWNAFDQVSNQPNLMAARTQLVNIAQQLSTTINSDSQGLTNLYNGTVSQVQSSVTSINQQLKQVATLNGQIMAAQGQNGANTLIDQRNQLVQSITDSIGARVVNGSNGSISILSGGIALVSGIVADSLNVQAPTAPATGTASIVSNSTGATLPVTSGTIGGNLAALNNNIPSYMTNLNNFAYQLATQVNGALAPSGGGFGYATPPISATNQLPAGQPLFSVSTLSSTAAATISVNQAVSTNPNLIASSSSSNTPMDGSIAAAVAALGSSSSSTSPDALYNAIVTQVGLDVSTAQSNVKTQSARSQSATSALASVSGVNTNQELVNMVAFQNAYQAAAKVIATVATSIQSLISAV
ncbi:flagellar hook-associated protein FlgK [Acidithrix ferrooxidans]|uniref:Flagellar hook-associated protein 1 n=1 Tax=Acidithrix ferrooxidans TaxID=1280514 RepID=A0A0D8HJK2_9ACTN|nr:flagellar hook-associated protein FlgK [Acidithrix ferrooxidans]KJF17937.1 flagellar hook-associated protein 1 [Acidithrix ferrooxidans]